MPLAGTPQAFANPVGGTVVGGAATISNAGSTLTVTQASNRAIINWKSFDIAPGETTQFVQPSSSSIALNRVTGSQSASQIDGMLNANGQVWIINPNGVMIGKDAQVNVAGLLATSSDIDNDRFMAGDYSFNHPGNANAIVSNAGTITVQDAGLTAFVAPNISNAGLIQAKLGKVQLASADSFTVDLYGDGLINLQASSAVTQQIVANSGVIQANGGQVLLTTAAAENTVNSLVNNTGIIEAESIGNDHGVITLYAHGGETDVSGILDAAGGGHVETSGETLHVADGTVVNTGGGEWLLDPQDFTIAASGGDMSGATLTGNLGSGNVTILSSSGGTSGTGSIYVNDAVSWSANKLTLTAADNIEVGAAMTVTGTGALTINTATANGGDGAVAGGALMMDFNAGTTGFAGHIDYSSSGVLTINGNAYTVISSLGSAGSTTGTDLQGMNGNLSGYYALGANIGASATSGWNSGAGFLPVGDGTTNFTGSFEGLGHVISGLTISRSGTDDVGLFGAADGASVRIADVGIEDASVTGNNNVGALVGIETGGGAIGNSYVTGTVSGSSYVGGLAGEIFNTTISSNYSTGAINSNGIFYTGGLVGFDSGGTITTSYATGTVTASGNEVGGLVGEIFNGTISSSYATGQVTSGQDAGGLVGNSNGGVIMDSYATGDASDDFFVGGLVGLEHLSSVTRSYSTGAASGSFAGGLVGYDNGGNTNTNSFWDTQTSGQSSSAGGTGETTVSMKLLATFSGAGWDIDGNQTGSTTTWYIADGSDYPRLRIPAADLIATPGTSFSTFDVSDEPPSVGQSAINAPKTTESEAAGIRSPGSNGTLILYVTETLLQELGLSENDPHRWWDGVENR